MEVQIILYQAQVAHVTIRMFIILPISYLEQHTIIGFGQVIGPMFQVKAHNT